MRNVWAAALLTLTTCTISMYAQDRPEPSGERLWKASLATFAASSVLDAASSWHKCEANSFLAGSTGQFDSKALLIKGGTFAGLAVFEQMTGKRHPRLFRYFSSANFAFSVGLTSVAVHNFSRSAPAPGYACR